MLMAAKSTASTKQPKALYILFFTELWERYGFYSVQTLLVLFLTQSFLFSDQQAYSLFGAFGALIYATPVIGGYLADKFLGFRQAIFFGGILFILGYLGLTFLGREGFYLSLSCLICGNGFFKSCVSSLLGEFYHKHDIRRESGFTLFYMGINLGAFAASFFGAWLAINVGWHYAFGMAALGIIIGLVVFTCGQKFLEDKGLAPRQYESIFDKGHTINLMIYFLTLTSIALLSYLLRFQLMVSWGILGFSIGIVGYLFYTMLRLKTEERKHMFALIILLLFSVAFWSLYYQGFTSTMLFIQRVVDRHINSWLIPTAMFHSVVPLVIIVFSPFMSWLWFYLAKKHLNFSAPLKFSLGLIFMGAGFFVLCFAIMISDANSLIVWPWIVFAFIVQTIGELSLSPVGLAMVTRLTPSHLVGMLMGVWFLSLGAATAIAGRLASFAAIPKDLTDIAQIKSIYMHVFLKFGIAGLALAVLLILLSPWIRKLMV